MQILFLLIIICILSFLIALPFIIYRRSKIDAYIEMWGEQNNFTIIDYEEREIFTPFLFSFKGRRRGQVICKVMLIDDTGNKRTAWLRFGGSSSRLSKFKVECKWDKKGLPERLPSTSIKHNNNKEL